MPKSLPSAPSIGPKDNKIDFSGVGKQHDHASGITVLFVNSNRYTCRLGATPETSEVLETLALPPGESLVRGDGVEDVELGLAHAGHSKRTFECVAACLR